uniref:Ankyrin repeat and SOCS box containing 15b n=1 Tax=Sparus aurata TaxID=8175 RepID=A0A671Z2K3_SPAAU
MDYFEQEEIYEELIEFAIRESFQDACRQQGLVQTDRYDRVQSGLSGCLPAFRERDSRGWLALHAAAVQPLRGVLRVVLQALTSADLTLEELTEDGDTALTLAVEAGLVANVKMLLLHGASPHSTNSRNESPLLIAVRQQSYDMVASLIMGGAFVEQVCHSKRTATHEAAKVGCTDILMLLLRHGAKVTARDIYGVTPLGIAAEFSNSQALDILIMHGGDVNAQANNGDTVLYDAAGSGNLDSIELLLQHGANPNLASHGFQLPIHRAAYEGHILALRTLISITTKKAIRLSGQDPVHSAADGGQVECLRLLIQRGFGVNVLLGTHISENYGDLRRTPLFFAISNGDATCAKMLLEAGARTELDPLRCILVAIRAERWLLLSYGAEVNCYFNVISNTLFPTALQYCLRDRVMQRLLFNSGYHAQKCFQCWHDKGEEMDSTWTNLHNLAYQIYSKTKVITFCEFVSVSWLEHLVGGLVRMLLDYVSHVSICPNLERILKKTHEWEEISDIMSKPRSLQHFCRLVIRGHMNRRTLNDPEAMAAVPFPLRLKNYVTYGDYDLYDDLSSK